LLLIDAQTKKTRPPVVASPDLLMAVARKNAVVSTSGQDQCRHSYADGIRATAAFHSMRFKPP